MVIIDDWNGQLEGLRSDNTELLLDMPIRDSPRGSAGAFLGRASDGKQYWIKPLNNFQGERVPITEQIIARAGSLIGAPVCKVELLEIPEQIAGWEFRAGRKLEKGIAHASLAVSDVTEIRNSLQYRDKYDNSSRHAYILALHDWCWGGDTQGLIALNDDHKFFSHDHGWYLPPLGASWTKEELLANIDVDHILNDPGGNLDMESLKNVCNSLEKVSREQIKGILKCENHDFG